MRNSVHVTILQTFQVFDLPVNKVSYCKGIACHLWSTMKNLPHVWFDHHAKFGSHTVCMHVGGPKNLEAGPYPLGRGLAPLETCHCPHMC